jgi:anaerobic magnesium-protoporphyrin IX monomethyl ester cyclase
MQSALLLISPPYSFGKDNLLEELNYHLPPQGLLSIASFVRASGFDVYLADCQLECRNIESFAAYLQRNFRDKPTGLTHIGISAVTISANNAFQIAKLCRDFYPESKIIMGGAHPTVMFEEVLEKSVADIVVYGEGEITMLELMQGISLNEIKGICYKDVEGKLVVNPPRERISDLDTLPLPAYDLIHIHRYKAAEGIYRKLPVMNMITSRGCPNQCTFCSKTLGSRVSVKSPERIIEEMLVLKNNFGIREIMFHDDTFTLDKKRVHALCDLIIITVGQNVLDMLCTR